MNPQIHHHIDLVGVRKAPMAESVEILGVVSGDESPQGVGLPDAMEGGSVKSPNATGSPTGAAKQEDAPHD